jgi:hypothetical protein
MGLFWLLNQQFEIDPTKRKAQLLNDWFLEGNIPPQFDAGGFVTKLNIDGRVASTVSAAAGRFTSVKTFTQKIGEGGGLVRAVQMKLTGETKPPAKLFEPALDCIFEPLTKGCNLGPDNFNPDGAYAPKGEYAAQVLILKGILTAAGFDPESAGIY